MTATVLLENPQAYTDYHSKADAVHKLAKLLHDENYLSVLMDVCARYQTATEVAIILEASRQSATTLIYGPNLNEETT